MPITFFQRLIFSNTICNFGFFAFHYLPVWLFYKKGKMHHSSNTEFSNHQLHREEEGLWFSISSKDLLSNLELSRSILKTLIYWMQGSMIFECMFLWQVSILWKFISFRKVWWGSVACPILIKNVTSATNSVIWLIIPLIRSFNKLT
jgi:hypothetical protein